MSNLQNRISRLEKGIPQEPESLPLAEAERQTSYILAHPQAVSKQTYNRAVRIVELLNIARERKAAHEQSTKPSQ